MVTPENTELTRDEWVEHLKTLSRKQIKQLFRTLPVPEVEEFHGEFEGILLNQGHPLTNAVTSFFINRKGKWLGKAFQPVSGIQGRGYNIFKTRRGVIRCLRMHVHCRESEDEKRLTLEYGDTNDGLVGRIYDDMRRVAPGLFLGIGTVPFAGGLMPWLKRRVMFAMVGPKADFREQAAVNDVFTKDETSIRSAA